MAEAVFVAGAFASFAQIICCINKCRVFLCDLPTASKYLHVEAKGLLQLAERVHQLYKGEIEEAWLESFLDECRALHKTAEDLRVDPISGHQYFSRILKIPLWKTKKEALEERFNRIHRSISTLNFVLTHARTPVAMVAVAKTRGETNTASCEPSVSNVPTCRSQFIGRSTELQTLVDKLYRTGAESSFALVGVSGIGKSRLARECALQVQRRSPATSLYWVDASSEASFEQSFLRIAALAGVSGTVSSPADVQAYLERNSTKSLLIVDGLNDPTVLFGKRKLLDVLPITCRILFTTQDRTSIQDLVPEGNLVRLRGLPSDDAELLFRSLLHGAYVDWKDLSALLADLDHSPSAIRHAGLYIAQSKISISKYREMLWSDVDLDNGQIRNIDGLTHGSSRKLFTLSYQGIRDRDPLAAEILDFVSILHHESIPRTLIALTFSDRNIVEPMGALDTFGLLEQSSEPGEEELFQLSHSAQLHIRAHLAVSGSSRRLQKMALDVLLTILPDERQEIEIPTLPVQCIPHAQEVLRQMQAEQTTEQLFTDIAAAGSLAMRVSGLLRTQGRYLASIQYARTAEELWSAAYGAESRESLKARAAVAEGTGLSGDMLKAKALWRQLLALEATVCVMDESERIAAKSNLAIVLHGHGSFQEAEEVYNEVLVLHERMQQSDQSRIKLLHNLAITLQSQEKYSEAERLHEEVLAWKQKTYGADALSTMSTINNLGALYALQERWDAAWQAYDLAFTGRVNLLGLTHPETLKTQVNMATVLEARGQYELAVNMARFAVELYGEQLGLQHADSLLAIRVLARVLHLQKEYKESEYWQRQAFDASSAVFGDEHPDTIALKEQADQLRDWLSKQQSSTVRLSVTKPTSKPVTVEESSNKSTTSKWQRKRLHQPLRRPLPWR